MSGIYVHVPFCHAKCAYCDFYSLADTRRRSAFVDRVGQEYAARVDELGSSPVRTIYFGGGTPSILPADDFELLAAFFPKDEVEEFTIEVNPEDVTAEAVAAWRSAGVNRVSMGVQSLVDGELAVVRRRHSAADALQAIDTIRAGGIANLSVDLIYGLPGQTPETFQYSLDTLLTKGVEHLSAYNLSFEEGTLLTRMLREGRVAEASEDMIVEMYARLCTATRWAGLEHYEISNFGLPGFHSRHNSAYWDGTPYLGLGPGAHSLDCRGVRRFNSPDLRGYLAGASAIIDEEDETDVWNDRIITALRTARGLDLDSLPRQYAESVRAAARPFIATGDLVEKSGHLTIPEDKWLISNYLMTELLVSED
ncbi:MAG: radical SAM family heme chaperone HemW [Bacteroidales bacterium]|nr:radical SAM family heme chaperone HemW [Bacteroidales bacterium]